MTEVKTTDKAVKTADKASSRFAKFGKYAGIAAFMFFLIKGLAWLVIGGLALWGING